MRVKVFIGRFQPFHSEHKRLVDYALSSADKVILLIGSSFQPRTIKNPWTYAERRNMILANYPNEHLNPTKLFVFPLTDSIYNNQKWAARVQRIVVDNTREGDTVEIIGHAKDDSSFYLDLFPQWFRVDHQMSNNVNASDIREMYFSEVSEMLYSGALPNSTSASLARFKKTDEYQVLMREANVIRDYKKSWEAAPYPPIFVTTDAVVVQSGHVLLVKRKAAPGEGQWALPGGFLNQNERIEDGMIRELREETRLKVPGPVLKGSIVYRHVFDHPKRSLRGRTITHAFLIQLPAGELPKVQGAEDAVKAAWIPIGSINSQKMFEDHLDIITYLLGSV